MTQEAAVPQDLIAKLQGMWRQDIANANRAASLRNASISSGGTLSITGGAFILEDEAGHKLFYVGPYGPPNTDGTAQQGWSVERADGTIVLALWDAVPSGGVLNQALSWYDRTGHTVVSDDTDSGEGLGRPWIPLPNPQTVDSTKWPSTTSSSYVEIASSAVELQQPKIMWDATANGTGSVQLLLKGSGGSTLASSQVWSPNGGSFSWSDVITLPAGYYGQKVTASVQAKATSGTVACITRGLYGRQT